MNATPSAGLRYSERFIAGSIQTGSQIRQGAFGRSQDLEWRPNEYVPQGCCGTYCSRKILVGATPLLAGPYLDAFDAVALFSMFTTWTRRLTSAIGWLGSLSLLLPYPTVTRSVPLMPYLSTR